MTAMATTMDFVGPICIEKNLWNRRIGKQKRFYLAALFTSLGSISNVVCDVMYGGPARPGPADFPKPAGGGPRTVHLNSNFRYPLMHISEKMQFWPNKGGNKPSQWNADPLDRNTLEKS